MKLGTAIFPGAMVGVGSLSTGSRADAKDFSTEPVITRGKKHLLTYQFDDVVTSVKNTNRNRNAHSIRRCL